MMVNTNTEKFELAVKSEVASIAGCMGVVGTPGREEGVARIEVLQSLVAILDDIDDCDTLKDLVAAVNLTSDATAKLLATLDSTSEAEDVGSKDAKETIKRSKKKSKRMSIKFFKSSK